MAASSKNRSRSKTAMPSAAVIPAEPIAESDGILPLPLALAPAAVADSDMQQLDENEPVSEDENSDDCEKESSSTEKTLLNVEVKPKLVINNTRGMLDSLKEFAYPADISILDCVQIRATEPLRVTDEAVNDDLKREQAFQSQALAAALAARRAMLALKLPFARPADFFAEMIKSDAQMYRVRQQLVADTKAIERSEEAKRIRTQRKFSKQVQAGVIQARQAHARELADKVNDFKKRRRNESDGNDFGDDEFDVTADDSGTTRRHSKQSRASRDKKYGFGGKKSGMRRNTAESSADVSGAFRNAHGKGKGKGMGKTPFAGKKGSSKSKSAAQKRPGSARRKQMASKRGK